MRLLLVGLTSLLAIPLLGYVGLCVYLWSLQDRLIYDGSTGTPIPVALQEAGASGLSPITDPTGQIVAFSPTHSDAAKLTRGTAVIFHGKGGHASQRVFYIPALESRGFRVVIVEYPGFDGRTGHPSEKQIVEEDRALVRRLAAAGQGPITLWGESLGTGVASSVAADPTLPIQGIVLITPFDSIEHIAAYRYPYVPVPLILRDWYDSASNLSNCQHPVVIVQAAHDTSIPTWSTDNLFNALPQSGLKKRILLPDCNHNNWPHTPEQAWWTEAADFVSPAQKESLLKP